MAWLMNLSCVYVNSMICKERYGDGMDGPVCVSAIPIYI